MAVLKFLIARLELILIIIIIGSCVIGMRLLREPSNTLTQSEPSNTLDITAENLDSLFPELAFVIQGRSSCKNSPKDILGEAGGGYTKCLETFLTDFIMTSKLLRAGEADMKAVVSKQYELIKNKELLTFLAILYQCDSKRPNKEDYTKCLEGVLDLEESYWARKAKKKLESHP